MTGHGGTRLGAGRPSAYREPLRRVTVALPDSYITQLRRFGGDNLSEGIRLLVEEAGTASGRPWYRLPDWAKDPEASTHPSQDRPSPP
jgi:hypothetical protein